MNIQNKPIIVHPSLFKNRPTVTFKTRYMNNMLYINWSTNILPVEAQPKIEANVGLPSLDNSYLAMSLGQAKATEPYVVVPFPIKSINYGQEVATDYELCVLTDGGRRLILSKLVGHMFVSTNSGDKPISKLKQNDRVAFSFETYQGNFAAIKNKSLGAVTVDYIAKTSEPKMYPSYTIVAYETTVYLYPAMIHSSGLLVP